MSVPSHDGQGRRLFDVDQLAAALGRDKRWIYRARDRGCPAYKIGRQLLFRIDLVEEWLATHRVGDVGDDGGPPG